MAFNKVGAPADTISVRTEGKTAHFCPSCKAMTEAEMSKNAFASGQPADSKCRKCGNPL